MCQSRSPRIFKTKYMRTPIFFFVSSKTSVLYYFAPISYLFLDVELRTMCLMDLLI
jgi:hypothetical protein